MVILSYKHFCPLYSYIQMRKARPRKIKYVDQDHTASEQLSWGSQLGLSALRLLLFMNAPHSFWTHFRCCVLNVDFWQAGKEQELGEGCKNEIMSGTYLGRGCSWFQRLIPYIDWVTAQPVQGSQAKLDRHHYKSGSITASDRLTGEQAIQLSTRLLCQHAVRSSF